MINFIEKNKKIIFFFIPTYLGIVFYFLVNILNILLFKINLLSTFYIIPDILFYIFLSYIIFLFSKKISIFIIMQFLFLLFIQISNSIKTSFFGAPIIFDDLILLKEAILSILMIDPFYLFILFFVFCFLFFVLIYNFKFRKSGLILISIFLLFIISLNIFPKQYNKLINNLDKNYLFWNQQENYKHNGPFVYFINQYIRSNHSNQIPKKEEIEKILNILNKNKIINFNSSNINSQLPNIHFILVESLWDPKLLQNIEFNIDPYYKDFRELRNNAKDNFLLSPTFEGKTANPEFEMLCGIPIMGDHVVFQTELKNNLDCLPRIFSKIGYETSAFHPDYANFFNRTNAYKKIGFDNYYSLKSYKMDDLNDGKLSDSSFLNQSYDILKNKKKPQFNYYITLSNHIPYSLNQSRPHIIKSNVDNYWINNYSNSIYYSTKETYDFIKKIQSQDPSSIIIIAGDHLPFLGMNKEVYEITKTLDLKTLYSTPFIIINNNKFEKTGSVNMYEFPVLLLDLLKINIKDQNLIINFFEIDKVRPLYVDRLKPEYIKDSYFEKNELEKKLNYYKNIYNDLLFGKQYSISK